MLCYCNIIYTHVNRISKQNSIRMKSKLHIWVLERSCSISIKIAEFWTFHIHICRYNLHVNFLNPIHVHLHPVNKAWNCVHNWHPCACAMNVQRTLLTLWNMCFIYCCTHHKNTEKRTAMRSILISPQREELILIP